MKSKLFTFILISACVCVLQSIALASITSEWVIKPLVNTQADEMAAVCSPDGLQLAYISNESGMWQIYIINSDGTNKWQLTDGLSRSYSSWHPDSNYIIYCQGNDLYKARLNVTRDGIAERWNLTHSSSMAIWEEPQFSPDGKWILASRLYNGWPRLWIMPNSDAEAYESDWTQIGKSYCMSYLEARCKPYSLCVF